MSLIETVASTILKFKVDVSDAKRGLKELAGEEKKAAEAAVMATEQRNQAMESLQKGIEKVSAGMRIANEVIRIGAEGWKEYEKFARQAGGADEERARSFRSAISSWDEGMQKLQIQIGRMVVALAPLVELAGRIIGYGADAINYLPSIGGLGGGGDRAEAERAFAQWKKEGKVGQGRGGDAFLFDATRADQYARGAQAIAASGLVSASAISTQEYAESVAKHLGFTDAKQLAAFNAMSALGYGAAFQGGDRAVFKDAWKGFKHPKTGTPNPTTWDTESRRYSPGRLDQTIGAVGADYGSSVTPGGYSPILDYGAVGLENARALNEELAKMEQERKKTVLETIFGAPEQFDLYTSKMELLKSGLDTFTGALQSHFDAWAAGSETLSQAVAGMGRDIVTGIASQLQAYAIKEGVLALISLAAGDVRGAGQHAIAAGAAEAGAITVGAIARHFNVGAGGGGGGGGGGYTGAPAGSGGGGDHRGGTGPTSITVVMGGDGNDSPRFRARAVKQGFDLAQRYEGQSKTVQYQ